jgi:hypothetical protein
MQIAPCIFRKFEGEQRRSAALLALEPHHQDTKKPLL